MFRNGLCAAPSCSGSRAALLTGSHGHDNGMMGLAHRDAYLARTDDPLRHGAVPAAPGARINAQDQPSAGEPTQALAPQTVT